MTTDSDSPLDVFKSSDEFTVGVFASAAAGTVARLVCHPVDTLKAKIQAAKVRNLPGGALAGLSVKSLYRGLGVTLIGGTPAVCLYLTTYDASKKHLSAYGSGDGDSFGVHFASGIIAEIVSCALFVPTDVIKERMQVQGGSKGSGRAYYKSTWDAISTIAKHEGIGYGLYKGYGASLLSFGPFSALYFGLYEDFKPRAAAYFGESSSNSGTDGSFVSNLIASASAGAIASYVTNPLDLAKLRLQIARMDDVTASSSSRPVHDKAVTQEVRASNNTFRMLAHVFRQEGVRGLYRGAFTRVLFHMPSTAITLACYDECKKLFSKQ